ncbi:MAG: hypothetical protein NZ839_03575, partial [Endomicrobia bacterium]|nr:hypothetical protein [Endomicrobiia bacterium]
MNKIWYLFFIMFVTHLHSAHTTLLITSQLLGGGYGFNKEGTSFGGKLNLSIIPAVKFKRSLLIPVYSLEYNGVKDVKELVGGGTLVQQYITNMLYIKPVFSLTSFLKLKPKVAATSQLIKETQDEQWSKGLFDYYKTNFAVETEWLVTQEFRVGLTPSFYIFNFYNYKSLASQKYGQELSSVGKDLLNFIGIELNLDCKINRYLSFNIYTTQKKFIDQYIVTMTGEYSSDKRQDVFSMLGVNFNYPVKPAGPTTLLTFLSLQYS